LKYIFFFLYLLHIQPTLSFLVIREIYFVCGLFDDAPSLSDCIMQDNEKWTGKEVKAVAAYLSLLSRHLSDDAGENRENSQDSLCPGKNSKWAPPEYKSDVLPLETNCSIFHKNEKVS